MCLLQKILKLNKRTGFLDVFNEFKDIKNRLKRTSSQKLFEFFKADTNFVWSYINSKENKSTTLNNKIME